MHYLKVTDFLPEPHRIEDAIREFRKYKKLTRKQIDRIVKLKEWEGKDIDFLFRGRAIKMRVVMVSMSLKEQSDCGRYKGWPLDFRLHYVDGKQREHEGFWTKNINNVLTEL